MAKVPSLPSNGQPIDTQYLYNIVESLISINSELSTYGGATVRVANKDYGVKKTSNLSFDAQTVNVVNSSEAVSSKVPKTGLVAFSTPFTKAPVVTATLQSKEGSTTNATVTITSVSSNSVSYKVDFSKDGNTTLDLNIIAIGV